MAAPAYQLAFLTMGLVTVLSAFIFRRLDAKPFNPERAEPEAVQAR